MIQDLENLIKLQDIDLRIKEQEDAREQYPAAAAELMNRVEAAEQARAAAAAKLEKAENGIKDINSQIAKTKENLARSQERLNSIKTNREYDAVHAEIEAQRGMLGTAENKRKTLEVEEERQMAALNGAESELERLKADLQPQIDDLNAKIGAIDSNIAAITQEREQVVPLVTLHTRRSYDGIRKRRKNGKVVAVVNASKACVHCFAVLRPQLYNVIRRGNDFIICENCGSMLVPDDSIVAPPG